MPGPEPGQPAPGLDPLVGQVVDDFEILERIGSEATGEVYRARQRLLNRPVTLKVLLGGAAADTVERFHAEAQALAALRHPNVLAVHYAGCADERHFLVLEYAEGETLAAVLEREGSLPADRVVALMRQVASALAALHGAGLVHCAVQPPSILVTPSGEVKLAGFGLARRRDEVAAGRMPAALLESLLYYPPEAARGKRLDERSDLYLLGATFYHALAGRPPFEGATAEERALQYARKDAPPLNRLLPTAPIPLCLILQKLLRRKPGDRYASAAEVVEALDRIEGLLRRKEDETTRMRRMPRREGAAAGEETAERPSPTGRVEARKRRPSKAVPYVAAAGVLAVAAVAVLVLGGGRRRSPEPSAAPRAPAAGTGAAETPGTAEVAPVVPVGRRTVRLEAKDAKVIGSGAKYEGPPKDCIGYWTRDDDWVQWEFSVNRPGPYDVQIMFAATRECAMNSFAVQVGLQTLEGTVGDTGGWESFMTLGVGSVTLPTQGPHTLLVRPKALKRGTPLMNLRAIILRPASRP